MKAILVSLWACIGAVAVDAAIFSEHVTIYATGFASPSHNPPPLADLFLQFDLTFDDGSTVLPTSDGLSITSTNVFDAVAADGVTPLFPSTIRYSYDAVTGKLIVGSDPLLDDDNTATEGFGVYLRGGDFKVRYVGGFVGTDTRIREDTLSVPSPVPDVPSWMTMIAGLGWVGAGRRARGAIDRSPAS